MKERRLPIDHRGMTGVTADRVVKDAMELIQLKGA